MAEGLKIMLAGLAAISTGAMLSALTPLWAFPWVVGGVAVTAGLGGLAALLAWDEGGPGVEHPSRDASGCRLRQTDRLSRRWPPLSPLWADLLTLAATVLAIALWGLALVVHG